MVSNIAKWGNFVITVAFGILGIIGVFTTPFSSKALANFTWGQIFIAVFLVSGLILVIRLMYENTKFESKIPPKLELDFRDEGTFLRENTDSGWESFWLRLRVMNIGGSVAEGCSGKITKFMDSKGLPINYDPLTLHWIETPWEYPFRTVELRKDEERYLDILAQKANNGTSTYLLWPQTRLIDELKPLPTNTSRIEVTIYSKNADSRSKKFEIRWDAGHSYKGIRLKEINAE